MNINFHNKNLIQINRALFKNHTKNTKKKKKNQKFKKGKLGAHSEYCTRPSAHSKYRWLGSAHVFTCEPAHLSSNF